MQILIAVEAKILRKRILNILKEAPGMQVIIYSRRANLVNEFTGNLSVIITDTGRKQIQKKQFFDALKNDYPALNILAIGAPESCGQPFDWLCIGATAAMAEGEINTCLLPLLKQLQESDPARNVIVSRQLLPISGNREAKSANAAVDYRLTLREKEILTAIVRGLSYKMAGYELNISPETVRGHIKNIYKKLMVNSQSQAVAMAIYQNLV